MSVEVCEDVPLEEALLTVEGELLGADGAHLPVALHVLLEAALLKVRREDDLAEGAALVDVTTAAEEEGKHNSGCVGEDFRLETKIWNNETYEKYFLQTKDFI